MHTYIHACLRACIHTRQFWFARVRCRPPVVIVMVQVVLLVGDVVGHLAVLALLTYPVGENITRVEVRIDASEWPISSDKPDKP